MKKKQSIILGAILLLSCINFIYILWFFEVNRYLPTPFFYNKEDTFMDFFNTLYWSGNYGIYTVWKSVYPPLNFLFLRLYQFLFMGEVLETWNAFTIRAVEAINIVPLLIIDVICVLVSVKISFKKIGDIKIKLFILFIILLSPVFLFAVERGNLILVCIPLLSWYIFTKKIISRALALAIMVNLKPYLIFLYFLQIINKKNIQENKDFLCLAPLFALIIFIITGLVLNQEFYLMPSNLLGFAADTGIINAADALSFPSTITSFSHFRGLINEFEIPPIIGHLTKLVVYFYLIKTILVIYNNKISKEDVAIFSIIFLTNYSTNTGGYGLLYYIPVIALFYTQKNWVLLSVIVIAMYLGVWDLFPIYQYSSGDMNIYLSGEIVKTQSYISLGTIIRPIANFIVLVLFFNNLKEKYLYE